MSVNLLCILNAILPGWTAEHKFHPGRRWRFDFAHPTALIAVEIEGAVWINGRHTRGAGYLKDMEKYNAAAMLGWRVMRYGTSRAEVARMVEEITKMTGGGK
jgi:hypothetical protein